MSVSNPLLKPIMMLIGVWILIESYYVYQTGSPVFIIGALTGITCILFTFTKEND